MFSSKIRDTVGVKLVESDEIHLSLKERNALISQLVDFYGIDFDLSYMGNPLSLSFTAKKVLLKDRNNNLYFFKQKPAYCSDDISISFFFDFQKKIHNELKLAPKIITSKSGNPFFQVNNLIFFLTPYVLGKEFNGSRKQSINAAKSLARIHKVSQCHNTNNTHIHETYLDNIRLIELLRDRVFLDMVFAKKVISRLGDLNNKHRLLGNFTTSAIHGDPAPFNIVFSEKEEVLVFNDFDNSCIAYALQDMAACILSFTGVYYYANTSSLNIPILKNINEECAAYMLRAYLKENPLPDLELNSLGSAMISAWVELMLLGLVRGDFEPRDIDEALEFPSALLAQLAKIF